MQNPQPNQYGAPPAPLSKTSSGEATAKTALGLDANLGAALGYPVGILAIIIFVMEKENRFARFHALQSLIYHVAAIVLFIALFIVWIVLGILVNLISYALVTVVSIVMWLVLMGVGLVYFAGLIFCAVKAYQSQDLKLPFIGNLAEKTINK